LKEQKCKHQGVEMAFQNCTRWCVNWRARLMLNI